MKNPYGTTVTPHYYRHHPSPPAPSHLNHHHHQNHIPAIISHHPQQHYHQLPVVVNNGQLQSHPSLQKPPAGEEDGGLADEAHATQIIVDPPRPPFIPKKPVFSGATNGCALAAQPSYSNSHYQMNSAQKPPSQPHHHIYAPPITSTIVSSTATTTTYIGGGVSGGNGSFSIDENQNFSNSSTNSSNISDERNSSTTVTTPGSSYFPVVEQHQQEPSQKSHYAINASEGNGNSAATNTFGVNCRTSPSASHNPPPTAAIVVQDLRNRFSNSANNGSNHLNGDKSLSLKQQRRLSLVGGIPQLQQMDIGGQQRPPISSFGCSDAARTHEGRIYATAGFGAAGAKKFGLISAGSNNSGLKSAGSQICLRENAAGHDGKSTLSRKAHKFAQKAAHRLTLGGSTLGSELSTSASALYSLFTSSSSSSQNFGENNQGGGDLFNNGNAAAPIYAESNDKAVSFLVSNRSFFLDKAPMVSAHTSRGIDFLERFGQFAKERAQIEEEYATKLKTLAKKSRGKKADDEEFRMFTTASAFQAMLNELESLASQHEVISERLRGELLPQLSDKCRALRSGRKKHSQDFDTMEKIFQSRVEELAKQRKNYEKAYQDAASAHVKYVKAEKNLSLSRLEVEKAKQNANTKSAICEQSKQGYAAQLATTNQAKFDHYNVQLPRLLEDMRRLDIDRIHFTKHAMLECVKAETAVVSIIQRCYTDMNTAIGTIDPDRDTHVVVEQTKTGYSHPQDFIFEDLGSPSAVVTDDTGSFDGSTMKRAANGKGIPRKQSIKLFSAATNGGKTNGTGGGNNSHAPGGAGSMGEYGNLPPQQRCRRIQKKLEELQAELKVTEQSQAGLERMHSVYSQNPKMGDPQEVGKQLEKNQHELDQLRERIQRFQNLLLDAQSELNQPLGSGGGVPLHNITTISNSSTIASSPGSSPRGSAGSVVAINNNGHQNVPRLNGGTNGPPGERRSSYSEASSISSADGAASMLHHGGQPANGRAGQIPLPPVQQTASTISTSGFSSNNAPTPVHSANTLTAAKHQQIQHIDADFYEECDGPTVAPGTAQHSDLILGTAVALYPYDAAQEEAGGTTISMKEGEELLLLERDVGDGWTRIRHQITNAEGFVPTSYLECKWYPVH